MGREEPNNETALDGASNVLRASAMSLGLVTPYLVFVGRKGQGNAAERLKTVNGTVDETLGYVAHTNCYLHQLLLVVRRYYCQVLG